MAEECPPALGRRIASPDHVLGHAGLSDIDAELEEFSMDPRRSPQRIGKAHLADKLAYLKRYKPIEANKSINRSMGLKVCFLGAVRRRTLICWRNVRISASSAAHDRNRSTTIQTMSLTRSLIRNSIARFSINC
jgi:hypothetical protein